MTTPPRASAPVPVPVPAPGTGPGPAPTVSGPGTSLPLGVAPPPLAEQGQPGWLVPVRAIGLLAALVLVGLGGLSVMAQFITSRTSAQVADYGPEVTELVIDSGTGDVTVELGTATRTTVRATQRFAFGVPVITSQVQDGILRLEQACRSTHWFPLPGDCNVDFEVTAPPGVGIRVASGAGDIRVRGATGALEVSSSFGDVTLTDIRSRNVRVTASAGDARLAFVAAPRSVSVRTSVGDIRVQVPADEHTYLVRTDTGAGDTRVDERLRNGSSDRVIELDTGAGDITVTGR